MNEDQPFRAVLAVAFLAVISITLYHRLKSQATGEKLDRRQEGLFILATLRPVGAAFVLGFGAYMISGDSVTVNYDPFRAGNNSGAVLEHVGLTLMVAGAVVTLAEGSNDWSLALSLTGTVPLVWGAIRRVQARERLSRAVWWYNRSLR